MTKSYKTDALAAIHETMEALHSIGAVNKQTLREIGRASCRERVYPRV